MCLFGVVCVELNYFPGDAFCVLILKQDSGGLQVIPCRGVLKARRNKNFYKCCYLLAFSPTSVALTTNIVYGIFEPGKSLFVSAVENAAIKRFVVVSGCGFDVVYLVWVLSKIDSCVFKNFPPNCKKFLKRNLSCLLYTSDAADE